MKKISLFIVASFLVLISVAQPPKVEAVSGMNFGKPVTASKAKSVKKAMKKLGAEEKQIKIKGTVTEVCKAEGCWIRVASDNGPILVRMKDHLFLVPLSLKGKEVVISGTGKIQETSVDMLKHYAEDAGKSAEEIAKITEPKREVIIQAEGVLVQ
jgi:hypothetical protein